MPEQATPRLIPQITMVEQSEYVTFESRIALGHQLIELGQEVLQQVRNDIAQATGTAGELPPIPRLPRQAHTFVGRRVDEDGMIDAEGRTFGSLFRLYRMQARLTQSELSERTRQHGGGKVDVTTISRIESNVLAHPRISTLRKLTQALGWREDEPRFYQLLAMADRSIRAT